MSTLTTTQLSTLPRVNLLPPEIDEQRRFRRLQIGLGAGVLASVGIVGALYFAALGDVSGAEDDLAVEQAKTASLEAQVAEYADVPAVIAQVDAAELQLEAAMSQEVRWSYYLNDLSLRIPSHVWLSQITMTQNVDGAAGTPVVGAAPAPTTTVPGTAPTYPELGLGTIEFEGSAFRENDVANWLQMVTRQVGWSQSFLLSTEEVGDLKGPNGDEVVEFKTQATITEDALSKRYVQKAGS